ncbi:MAG: Transcriptional regulator, PadR family [uncultured Cytophagales bacterium]|uniref:Transcriptional regulator, PadR family n=1 Tax=uncultured Cytophagales bacterium TaxID=158755 RepID=A0A6J4HUG5_9SPHI|nr:MAG: Transcriptional regulator, PadR family [uncultured Cytophagales bacterium]
MRRAYLGEFEELVLLIVALHNGEAYGVSVAKELLEKTGRAVSISAVHVALHRLQEKGLVASNLGGASAERGGRRKRYFTATAHGQHTLREIRDTRNQLFDLIPNTAWT